MDKQTTSTGRDHNDGAESGKNPFLASRRSFLAIGAVTASTVVTIKPALAQTVGSVLNCEIPIRDYVAPDGSVTTSDTAGAVPPATFKGEDVKNALNGSSLPGTTTEERDAYLNYIKRLQYGQSGFTCYASLQNPRG